MKWKERPHGAESPYIPAGPFKIRLPFVHYRFEWPDYAQGLLMCAVDLGAITLLADYLGMPFEVALAVVILNGIFYLFHHLLGDPVIPGWITPAIPLIVLFVKEFEEGPDRVYALIAFQLTLGILSIFLGVTGLASKVVRLVPDAIKSGIILGAGIGAIVSIFEVGGKFELFPYTITICIGFAFYLIFSKHFEKLKKKNKAWGFLGNLGILPAILLAVIVAPLFGEAKWPAIQWGFSNPDFMTLWSDYTVFGLGFPPFAFFAQAIPAVLATYLVVFGDVLKTKALLSESDVVRSDEKVDYNPNRAHLIFGGRNAIMSIIGPDITMAGPMWAAMQVVVVERFKEGKKAMNSFFGGAGSFRWGTNTGLLLLPIVSLVQPILAVALSLTLLVQGYVSVRIGVMQARSQRDLGIAGVVGAILVIKGATMAFAAGIILCVLLYGKDFLRGENDYIFTQHADKELEKKERKAV
ncbi:MULTISPECIES: hypothetical protein [Bacillaceae]|uniref:hypothetical protein n=1 Tax=Bacillaceae TaxID=186817 RepID=UPI000C75C0B5|nr:MULTISPECIES: hypothetical protein [Bacillaceae]PLR66284.1 hypothetical protein CYJ36_19505 [Bacillus sp. UMB0893]QNG61747.1 hypothetical protein H4O14_09920 [Bacillus sp. PAMC26568]